MTQEKAKELLPIIQAISEGKDFTLQTPNGNGGWVDCNGVLDSELFYYTYRIKPEGNPTIEQNAGENRIEGGVVSISGSLIDACSLIDAFRCWKCGRILPISERTDIVYTSNPPKYSCKECERIKKEKQYRPFNNCNELIEYWYDFTGVINCSPKLFMPTIWVKHKRYETENLIQAFDDSCVFVQDIWVDMKELFDNFTFLDGSPCGLEE